MRRLFMTPLIILFLANPVRADMFGGDIAVLLKILAEATETVLELKRQRSLMEDELRGINDTIRRLSAMHEVLTGNEWNDYKNPVTALENLRKIYRLLPESMKNEKSQKVEKVLGDALYLAHRMKRASGASYRSGEELERRALNSSPGVANKLTASGVGSLVSLQSQNNAAQAEIIGLLSQMIAETSSKEAEVVRSRSENLKSVSGSLTKSNKFLDSTKLARLDRR